MKEKANGEKRKLYDFLEKQRWSKLNGNVRGDKEGEWTFTGGRDKSVIDYIIGDKETRNKWNK